MKNNLKYKTLSKLKDFAVLMKFVIFDVDYFIRAMAMLSHIPATSSRQQSGVKRLPGQNPD